MLHSWSVTITNLEEIFGYIHLTFKQAILVVLLVLVFTFFSVFWVLRTEYTSDPSVFIWYAGFPFEALKIKNIVDQGWYFDVGTILNITSIYEFLWGGLIINLITHILFSIFIVKLAAWVHEEIEYRRYYKS